MDEYSKEPSEELMAAIAAMREEWKTLGPEVLQPDDPEMGEEERATLQSRRAALVRDFFDRHQGVVEALTPNHELLDTAPLDAAGHKFQQAEEEVQRTEEQLLQSRAEEEVQQTEDRLLQSRADLAEARQGVVEEMLGMLAGLEALPSEGWAAMGVEQRNETYESLRQLQEARPVLLAELPAERRRHWEQQ